jgi:protein-disulfide isomerase
MESILRYPVMPERDHLLGPPDAPVQLVEYGDFECPFCGQAHPVVAELKEIFGDGLCFVFRHFPITTAHPHAQSAAEAAEAAGAQGSFWPMHDTLFENQHALDDRSLVSYAASLDLDVQRFSEELLGHVHTARVREDFMTGVRSGVNGTPAFYIQGLRYDGPRDLPTMARVLEAARESAYAAHQ